MELRGRDFLILSENQKNELFKNPDSHHEIIHELSKARSLFKEMFSEALVGKPEEQLKYLIDVYSKFYPFERDSSGRVNYEAARAHIDASINGVVQDYETIIYQDIPNTHRNQAELNEDVKGNIISIISLASKKTSRGYQARLVLSKLIDWIELSYEKPGLSLEEEMDKVKAMLNQNFFITDPKTSDIKEGSVDIIRFVDVDNYLMTHAYALFDKENNIWQCYDKRGVRMVNKTIDELRESSIESKNIFEETTDRKVRYFNNPYPYNEGKQEWVHFSTRTKEIASASAKMYRYGTRNTDDIRDKNGIMLTVPNMPKIHTCEKALDRLWNIVGIRTDYVDTFHSNYNQGLNVLSAPDMQIVKYNLHRPYNCEVIIDSLQRSMDAVGSIGLVNHELYRYRQNMRSGIQQNLVPNLQFSSEELMNWIEQKVLNLSALNARIPRIKAHFGSEASQVISKLQQNTIALMYNEIKEILKEAV